MMGSLDPTDKGLARRTRPGRPRQPNRPRQSSRLPPSPWLGKYSIGSTASSSSSVGGISRRSTGLQGWGLPRYPSRSGCSGLRTGIRGSCASSSTRCCVPPRRPLACPRRTWSRCPLSAAIRPTSRWRGSEARNSVRTSRHAGARWIHWRSPTLSCPCSMPSKRRTLRACCTSTSSRATSILWASSGSPRCWTSQPVGRLLQTRS